MFRTGCLLLLAALASAPGYVAPLRAQTIIDEWQGVKVPPAPALKSVTLDPKTTALLVMDLVKQTCNEKARPRCVASLPKVAKLVSAARAKGAMIIYTTVPPVPLADTVPQAGRKGDEPVVTAWVDKFTLNGNDTGLDKMLKEKGITSVITVGTAVHGAVLYTASEAALRGFNVIVPVDGLSGNGEVKYDEQAVVYILASAPIVSSKITLSRTDMISFQ